MRWRRLESATVDPDLTEGLEARIADPLWLLARQWQTGEFRGEDAADPLLVHLTSRSVRIDGLRLGGGPTVDADSIQLPLEALVEAEPIRGGRSGDRISAELGQILLSMLPRTPAGRALAGGLRAGYPISLPADDGLDPAGRRRLDLLATASIDGAGLAAALAADAGLAARLVGDAGATGRGATSLAALLNAWASDSAAAFVEPGQGSAWDQRRLEYSFQLVADGGDLSLSSREYPGGDLHWFHFDFGPGPVSVSGSAGPQPGATAKATGQAPSGAQTTPVAIPPPPSSSKPGPDSPPTGPTKPVPGSQAGEVGVVVRDVTVLPVPLRYAGMPAGRFWEFEESEVFYGGIEAGPTDLARVALANYATSYGDDWYLVPLRLPAGTLTRIVDLEVIDDYGIVTAVPAAAVHDGPDRSSRYFELTGDAGPDRGLSPLLAVLPTVDTIEASRPLEDVRFVRDEMANLAWAVEQRIETATGRPVDLAARSPVEVADGGLDAVDISDDRWQLVLATAVPDNWVPLVPVRLGEGGAMLFQRGRMPAEGEATRGARSVILDPDHRFLLHEEEVPFEGLRVIRTFQETRVVSGRRFTWVGRRKGPGRGEGQSGLTFDRLIRGPGED